MNQISQRKYDSLPEYLKHDMIEAGIWARNTLRDREGIGHHFEISTQDGLLTCSFAKPEWAGDHSGPYMDTAAEAICAAVCTYLGGE